MKAKRVWLLCGPYAREEADHIVGLAGHPLELGVLDDDSGSKVMRVPYDENPDELLEAAARLSLRLTQRCDWVEGCEDTDDPNDRDSWNSLYERIRDLMGAYVKDESPDTLLTRFAGF